MIDGLDPSNEAEAVRRYKAHLDERDKPKPSERSAARSFSSLDLTCGSWLATAIR
jgi:hypothetical protein